MIFVLLTVPLTAACFYEESGVLTFGRCNLIVQEPVTVTGSGGEAIYIHPVSGDESEAATAEPVEDGQVPFAFCRMRYRYSSENRVAYVSERTHVHTQLATDISDDQINEKKYGEKQNGFLNLYEFYGSPAAYDENHLVWRLGGQNFRLDERAEISANNGDDPERIDFEVTFDEIPIVLDSAEELPEGWQDSSAFCPGRSASGERPD